GKDQDAVTWLRKAVQHAPATVENHVRLAGLLRRLDNGQRGPLGKEAEAEVREALWRSVHDAGALLLAAEMAADRGDWEAARGHLEHGRKRYPRDGRFDQSQAVLEMRAGQREQALACLRQGLAAPLPPLDKRNLDWTLANLLIDDGDLAEAKKAIIRLRKGVV